MTIKKLVLSALIGVAAATAAQAQNIIHITGATAFRANVYRALTNEMGATLQQNPAGNGGTLNKVTLRGLVGGVDTLVRMSYSGSAAGVEAMAAPNPRPTQNYFSSSVPGDTLTLNTQADLAFSDVFQATTIYFGGVYTDLEDFNVGVQPFVFMRGVNSSASIVNVGTQVAQTLFSNGAIPLALVTGSAADETSTVYLTGRDTGSGTRLGVQTDLLFTGTDALYNFTGGNWVPFAGFSSGSGVAGVLVNPAATQHVIGYTGLGDRITALAGGADDLTYNGVAYTTDAVKNGPYTLWSYEHLFNIPGALDATDTAFRDRLIEILPGQLGTTAIPTGDMRVQRFADGGPISNVY